MALSHAKFRGFQKVLEAYDLALYPYSHVPYIVWKKIFSATKRTYPLILIILSDAKSRSFLKIFVLEKPIYVIAFSYQKHQVFFNPGTNWSCLIPMLEKSSQTLLLRSWISRTSWPFSCKISCKIIFFVLQIIFLKIWKIQEKTIKNVCRFRSSESFSKMSAVNCNYR